MAAFFKFLEKLQSKEVHLNSDTGSYAERTKLYKEIRGNKLCNSHLETLNQIFNCQTKELVKNLKDRPNPFTKETTKPKSYLKKNNDNEPDNKVKTKPPKPLIQFGTIVAFRLAYMREASKLKESFYKVIAETLIKNKCDKKDAEIIFNFFSRVVYEFGISKLKEDLVSYDLGLGIDVADDVVPEMDPSIQEFESSDFDIDPKLLDELEKNDVSERSPEDIEQQVIQFEHFFSLNGDLMATEPVSTLYKLGGGTIGQIKNVTKLLKEKFSYSLSQKIRERNIYGMVKKVCQSKEEKEANLPICLKIRDYGRKGGMMIPKKEFLPFIRLVINLTRKFASAEGLEMNRENMIKVCKEEINKHLGTFWALFCRGLPLDCPPTSPGVKDFFQIWLRKLVNSRIQEFFEGFKDKVARESLNLGKGGQNLRDKLYAAVTRNKKLSKKVKNLSKPGNKKATTEDEDLEIKEVSVPIPPKKRNLKRSYSTATKKNNLSLEELAVPSTSISKNDQRKLVHKVKRSKLSKTVLTKATNVIAGTLNVIPEATRVIPEATNVIHKVPEDVGSHTPKKGLRQPERLRKKLNIMKKKLFESSTNQPETEDKLHEPKSETMVKEIKTSLTEVGEDATVQPDILLDDTVPDVGTTGVKLVPEVATVLSDEKAQPKKITMITEAMTPNIATNVSCFTKPKSINTLVSVSIGVRKSGRKCQRKVFKDFDCS